MPKHAGLRICLTMALAAAGVTAGAGDVEIVHVKMYASGSGEWSADVTLRHGDTGWEHYADAWRVVDADGADLGTRTLFHPHVGEQPFTRSLSGIAIDGGANAIWIEAHDKVHGWSPDRVRIDLGASRGDRFEIER